jgi:hypothetical protein
MVRRLSCIPVHSSAYMKPPGRCGGAISIRLPQENIKTSTALDGESLSPNACARKLHDLASKPQEGVRHP